MNNVPRRIRLDLNTPAELSIVNAMQEVDKLPPDTRLTNAIILLAKAKELVSDFVDNVPASLSAGGPGDYWKHRCKLAEKVIDESPCDPDITSAQIKAHDEYRKFLAGSPIPEQDIRTDAVAMFKPQQLAGGQSAGVWIDAHINLPKVQDKVMKPVLVKYETGTGEYKRIRHTTAYYFPEHFKNVEWEDWDDYSQEDFPYTEEDTEKGIVWLRPGWYQNIECEKCEGYWSSPMRVIKWMPIPDESLQPATTGEDETHYGNLKEAVRHFIEVGKRDMSNPKYDGYWNTLMLALAASTSSNATERQEGEKDYAEFQEWRKGVIPGTNGTATDLYFYWLNNIKTNQ